jgi:hypothetical protein
MMRIVVWRIRCDCIVTIEREGVRERYRALNDAMCGKNTQNQKQLFCCQWEPKILRSSLRSAPID